MTPETSRMRHLRPGQVRRDRLEAGSTAEPHTLMPLLEAGGLERVSANGILGDLRCATAAEGRRILEQMARLAFARLRPAPVR